MEVVFTKELRTWGRMGYHYITVEVGGYTVGTSADAHLADLIYELMNGAILKDSARSLYEVDDRKAIILEKLARIPLVLRYYLVRYLGKKRTLKKLNMDVISRHLKSGGTDQTLKEAVDDIFDIAEYFGLPISKEERYRLYIKLMNS